MNKSGIISLQGECRGEAAAKLTQDKSKFWMGEVYNMVTKEQIARINELAKKKKAEGLTAEEQAEQKVLYRAYIDAFKANLRAQLENIEIIDEDKQEVEKIEEEVEALEETLAESENKLK